MSSLLHLHNLLLLRGRFLLPVLRLLSVRRILPALLALFFFLNTFVSFLTIFLSGFFVFFGFGSITSDISSKSSFMRSMTSSTSSTTTCTSVKHRSQVIPPINRDGAWTLMYGSCVRTVAWNTTGRWSDWRMSCKPMYAPFFPLHLPLSFSRSTHLTLSLSTNATLLLMRRVGNGSSLRGLCCRPSREMATSGTVVHGAISWVIRVGLQSHRSCVL